jgi:CRP-like cAMP-binding protein
MCEPATAVCLAPRVVAQLATRMPLASPAPWRNQLLAALPPRDYERLLPDLEPVALPVGWTIHGPGEAQDFVYFITAGLVSRSHALHGGQSVEFAIAGRDGVVGVASFLGAGGTPSSAIVLSSGHAHRLDAGVLEAKHGGGALEHLLLRYAYALMAQAAQSAVCNRHHSLEQRFCRWILGCLDRLPSNELAMTHELVAHVLGVRRESVSQVTGRLQMRGLLHCERGHIVVLDRPRLEAEVCECYSVVRRAYENLLPTAPLAPARRIRPREGREPVPA